MEAALKRGNPVVFFDVSMGGRPLGRIKMELFKDVCPKVLATCSDFIVEFGCANQGIVVADGRKL